VIDSAPEGTVLLLEDGAEYLGPITISRSVSIRRSGPIPVLGSARVVDSKDQYDFLIAIVGGAPHMGQLSIQSGSVTIAGIVFTSTGAAEAVSVQGGTVHLRQCAILSNGHGATVGWSGEVELTDSAVWSNTDGGVEAEAGSSLAINNCIVLGNSGFGLAISGRAVVRDSLIWSTLRTTGSPSVRLSYEGAPASVLKASGAGVVLLDGADLCMSDTWIMESEGPGLAFGSVVEPLDAGVWHLSGVDNTIPGPSAPFQNSYDILPNPEDWPGSGETREALEFWPAGFFADNYSATLRFDWTYRGAAFSLVSTVEIPSGGPTTVASQSELDQNVDPGALGGYASAQCIRTLTESLVALAAEKGYEGLAEASFIAGFVQDASNVRYDYVRMEDSLNGSIYARGWFYPAWTLARRAGVCRDKALLMGQLLNEAGFDTVLVHLDPVPPQTVSHVVVGLAVDGWGNSVDYDGSRYYLIEATQASEIGDFSLTNWFGTGWGWTIAGIESVAFDAQAGPVTARILELPVCESSNPGGFELEIRNLGTLTYDSLFVCLSYIDVTQGWDLLAPCPDLDYYFPALGPGETRRLQLTGLSLCGNSLDLWVRVYSGIGETIPVAMCRALCRSVPRLP
jgi:hypothetical protein